MSEPTINVQIGEVLADSGVPANLSGEVTATLREMIAGRSGHSLTNASPVVRQIAAEIHRQLPKAGGSAS